MPVEEFPRSRCKSDFFPSYACSRIFPEADENQIFYSLISPEPYKDIMLSNLANTAAKAITVNFSSL